ncbi:hypothetical protein [Actinoplanes italicus]|uniref:Uncharacterized protein n=1 Tax=Actinoplanes italicus TaxID=113567 RepID=A0A2T0JEI8_9ACTN|nr:hypothetical protein [Actinoplanes italicus]PRX05980.1 hypothetical protein CLV67_1444 [Actinoplanes italicus]
MDATTLHVTARRYLMRRDADLRAEYERLPGGGRQADGYTYTTEAKRTFPRYNVVAAILVEVERLDPDRLPGVEDLGRALLTAAQVANSVFTEPPHGEIQAQAMADERRLFAANVQRWRKQSTFRADPLPYRRVLTPQQGSTWRAALQRRWDVQDGLWHPMLGGPIPLDVLVLDEGSMWEDEGVDHVRQVLRGLGRSRVVELREYGPDYLLDVMTLAPRYTGPEGLWTDEHHDWIAYASHEGTVAFGGVLAANLLRTWPGADSRRWRFTT